VNTYDISNDPARLQLAAIHAYLLRSDGSPGIPQAVVARAIANSMCFGLYRGDAQVGFARVITDQATFAWICDVFVDDDRRGQGIGKGLLEAILADPRLAGLKRTLLATSSPAFYAPFGFAPLENPERWLLRPGPVPTD